ncbi:uncharacterized protein DSM5745_09108 [Aspergillus mulundensis]|uniref:Uncharacterized protein n=1 Tax=Aspergillus mulundensis TaxID=1810919 RepID=A0A3D8QZK2_9EURO|nr:Uncharacterized protein DSM5745_09108 [Aspergillus mulundensis]RDW67242.1 Uncharacterized protein DSM5745_09108 [Aspergillus mulundensis]
MPPLERHLQIPVSIKDPTPLRLSSDLDQSRQEWFGTKGNHISVLILAWSYILSARWAEIMPEATLTYTHRKASNSDNLQQEDSAVVDIGAASNDAARWWAAILATGTGWEAFIPIDKDKFWSPWSISLPPAPGFGLSYHNTQSSLSDRAIPAAAAFRFLCDYCALHGIVDQGYAALSAVVLLPFARDSSTEIVLPRLTLSPVQKCRARPLQGNEHLDLAWVQGAHHLDKLLTLSCNTRGVHSLLSSVLYERDIACNAVDPWLQSIFAVLSPVTDTRILANMLMRRVPHLAFLWLGGAILDIHRDILQDGHFGLIPTDAHAAAWSQTMQSFMQEPVHPAENGSILRSDECRLLYLTQEERHTRWPICQWTPFGTTALQDTDIDVRLHADCIGHGLRYAGWRWTCRDGSVVHQVSEPGPSLTRASPPIEPVMPDIAVNYEAFEHGKALSASENATRNIFGWLRVEGYAPGEQGIREWIEIDEGGEADGSDDGRSVEEGQGRSHAREVQEWMSRCDT